MTRAPAAALALVVGAVTAAAGGFPGVGVELASGVFLDPTGTAVYLDGKDGRVEAVDAATGRRLWQHPDPHRRLVGAAAGRVVLLADDRPAGKEPGFHVLSLDAATGKAAVLGRVGLPDWSAAVAPGPDAAVRQSFHAWLLAEGGGPAVVWVSQEHYVGGTPPGPDVRLRWAAGRVRLDLAAGRVVATDALTGNEVQRVREKAPPPRLPHPTPAGAVGYRTEPVPLTPMPWGVIRIQTRLVAERDGAVLWKRDLRERQIIFPPPSATPGRK